MNNRTRLQVARFLILVQTYVAIASLHLDHTDVTIIALGGLTATGGIYKWMETKNPSVK